MWQCGTKGSDAASRELCATHSEFPVLIITDYGFRV